MLHGLDVRFKLVFLVLISLVSLKAQALELAVLTCTLFVLMINAGVTAKSIVGLLRHVFFTLMLVFIARALSIPDHRYSHLRLFPLPGKGSMSISFLTVSDHSQ